MLPLFCNLKLIFSRMKFDGFSVFLYKRYVHHRSFSKGVEVSAIVGFYSLPKVIGRTVHFLYDGLIPESRFETPVVRFRTMQKAERMGFENQNTRRRRDCDPF